MQTSIHQLFPHYNTAVAHRSKSNVGKPESAIPQTLEPSPIAYPGGAEKSAERFARALNKPDPRVTFSSDVHPHPHPPLEPTGSYFQGSGAYGVRSTSLRLASIPGRGRLPAAEAKAGYTGKAGGEQSEGAGATRLVEGISQAPPGRQLPLPPHPAALGLFCGCAVSFLNGRGGGESFCTSFCNAPVPA